MKLLPFRCSIGNFFEFPILQNMPCEDVIDIEVLFCKFF